MHQRTANASSSDPYEQLVTLDRRGETAWIMANMVTSLDGASATDGTSGGLGGPGDKTMFQAIRDLSDVIIAGSATVTAEDYQPPRPGDTRQARRKANGGAAGPVIAIVTNSLRMDPSNALFGDQTQRPIIITSESANPERAAVLAEVAEIIVAGGETVSLEDASRALFERGHRVQLVEGGPRLLGQFIEARLVDEFFVTVAPVLVGGPSSRIAVSSHGITAPMELASVLEDGNELYLRYLRPRSRGANQRDQAIGAAHQ